MPKGSMIKTNKSSDILSMVFFRLLPVQILVFAMGSVNSLADGVVASRFIDPITIGVVGLYFTMVKILEAIGNVMLGLNVLSVSI